MGLIGNILGKSESAESQNAKEKPVENQGGEGKYDEPCSLCGASHTEKKWAGKYFHRKCLRKMKKAAKGML